ncbi:ABC transporter permease [Algoriphagus sediminis]|uniref:ABC transporter permease n=1 Tax=Algoriphagus sediminis TaxID=3057113 RepID=A0ABT7Y9Z7_9BACT|nr:FtsX-like permease family protein [Algoriphagus sediminis]MDN3203333.1 ABC transporter permease [Algoriphagus sediminis]
MWKNYLKISFRNLKKRKLYTAINLLGLTVALVSFILISLYIHHEWSYDRMYTGSERIYRFTQLFADSQEREMVSSTPSSLPPTVMEEFDEAEAATLLFDLSIFQSVVIEYQGEQQEEKKFAYADENFFDVFDFEVLVGNPQTFLSEPRQMVLTKSTARRYFGSEFAAEGKTLKVETSEYLITGVMEDFPSNSHIDFDFIVSFKSHRHGREPEWSPSNYYTYVKVKEGTNMEAFESKLATMSEKYLGKEMREYGIETGFFLQPVIDIHLGDQSLNNIKPTTDIKYLYIFAVVALLLIAIGVINYVNLATAEATERNKEVGLRKVLGAMRGQLFGQFVSESMILTFASLLFSLLAIYVLAPQFSNFVGFEVGAQNLLSPISILGMIGLVVLVGLLAGIYPSLILSGMEPIKALGNNIKLGGGAWVRKGLVVFQFFVSMGLLIATFVVESQLSFMREVNLGYNQEQLISINYPYSLRDKAGTLVEEMKRSGSAISGAQAANSPIFIQAGYSIMSGGDNPEDFSITGYSVDKDIVQTLDLELLAGEDFSDADPTRQQAQERESIHPVLFNENAIRRMGWDPEEAIGKTVNLGFGMGRVKGVVKDFYFNSLHYSVGPLVIFNDPNNSNVLLLRLPGGNPAPHLAKLEEIWKETAPGRPFNYEFVDSAYGQMYNAEQRISQVFGLFSGIAIFIACMGLFGLVSYVALRRTREISIRKVLGATQINVIQVLSADFFKLLLVSSVMAIGFGMWFASSWLQDFANRTQIGALPYVISILVVLALATITISYRAWKVFKLNPAKTLKTE